MFKLFRYMKKSLPALGLIVVLLIVQAFADLSLPALMSDIVNVGIQQSGIESPVPSEVRQETLAVLEQFMTAEERAAVDAAYENGNGRATLRKGAETEQLGPAFSRAAMLAALASGSFDAQSTGIGAGADMGALQSAVAALAAAQGPERDALAAQFQEQLAAMPDSILSQVGVEFVKGEYTAMGYDMAAMQSNYILLAGGKMILMAILSVAAAIAAALISSRISARLSMDLRGMLFRKVIGFSNAETGSFSTASLITRSTNDIQQVQLMMVMLLRMVLYAPILGIGGVFMVLTTNSDMAWILAVAVGAVLMMVTVMFGLTMPRFKRMQKLVDRVNLVTRETLTGLPVIRAFSRETHEEQRFDEANTSLTRTALFVTRVMALMMPLMMFVMNGVTLLIMWNGAGSIDAGAMQVGDMMAFIQYAMIIIMAFLMVSMFSVMLPRASVSAARIIEVLDTPSSIRDPQEPAAFGREQKGVVEFRDVSFKYPGAEEYVLEHISFTARPGQTTAIIGSTGSGKSTLINLIPRFFDATEGELLVDGQNVKNVRQHDLRARIGYVPQRGVLFSGTIRENIKYGSQAEIDDEAMEKAARIAQAEGFILEKEAGYGESIAQGGTNVSGGQRQRLSIARAIAKSPEILIFDDSFSALDFKTDSALRKALWQEAADSTVIVVAQRISTVLSAEQIIVLDEGRIAGIGAHRELMESCEVYRDIALSQLSKEELA